MALPVTVFVRSVFLVVVCTALAACSATQPAADRSAALSQRADSLAQVVDRLQSRADSLDRAARLRNPNLHSTLWMQTAVEYEGVARSAYQLASVMMDRALRDSTWTASLEQADGGPERFRDLPPAVVLDVDETVLDNSAYQARLIEDNETYDAASWNDWCRERAAVPVPGALAFTQAAAEQGVQVIYLTNRDAEVEDATRDNLRTLGFPVDDAPDAVLTQKEREGWDPKGPRRAWVAERYRILLLLGDNLGDFASGAEASLAERETIADRYDRFWGTRWIVLPNPQYGSWEGALFDFNYGVPPLQKLETKHDRLQTTRSGAQ